MSELRSLLDQIAAFTTDFDPHALGDEELREDLPALQAALNQLTAALTRGVRAADQRQVQRADGMVSMKVWLTGHCRLSGRDAAALITAGRRLEGLPRLADAYAQGAVTAGHVQTITSQVTPARVAKAAAGAIDLAVTDDILTGAARRLGPEDTARAVRRWVTGIDPDGTLDDAAGMPRVFRMAVSAGGRVYLSGHLDGVGGETVHTALEAVLNGHRPTGDTRTHAQQMGDALVELCRQSLQGGRLPEMRGERPQVRVTIDWMALCAERDAVGVVGGELPFAGPIHAETARRLACDAGVVRIITGPDGQPLDVGRAQRTATAAIRRAVEIRDRHCIFAGCTAPPAWCDVHHLQHWAHGGPTSADNSGLLCERHHAACHEGGFRVERDTDGVWHTYRRDGTEIIVRSPGYPLRL